MCKEKEETTEKEKQQKWDTSQQERVKKRERDKERGKGPMIEARGGKKGGRQRQISVVKNEKDERRVLSVHRVLVVADLHCKSSLGSLNQIRLAAASTANLDLSLSPLAFNPGDARHWLSIENHPHPSNPLHHLNLQHPPHPSFTP